MAIKFGTNVQYFVQRRSDVYERIFSIPPPPPFKNGGDHFVGLFRGCERRASEVYGSQSYYSICENILSREGSPHSAQLHGLWPVCSKLIIVEDKW